MERDLFGRVAIVTGGARGIGAATAEALAAEPVRQGPAILRANSCLAHLSDGRCQARRQAQSRGLDAWRHQHDRPGEGPRLRHGDPA